MSVRHVLATFALALAACAVTFPDYPQEKASDGGPGSTCDGTGDCTQCKQCSAKSVCPDQYQACIADGACELVLTCVSQSCMPPTSHCEDPCLAHATDATHRLFAAFYDCIVCDACHRDCTVLAAAPLCP